ncbi:hypothetical protein [Exiguobacterium sp. ZOR0005]|uniref:hypothetical protein n=1 Tax=Exiguobacterium sp. ZOR0005 TaxID=1339226 RepID=UPI000645F159|nr:hypothetical protein [Exiguobacterium sp. ZOR0005]
MNKPKVRDNLEHILKIINSIENGKSTINKLNNDSDYQKHIYTPEVLLAQIKDCADKALKGFEEYE